MYLIFKHAAVLALVKRHLLHVTIMLVFPSAAAAGGAVFALAPDAALLPLPLRFCSDDVLRYALKG